MAADLFYNEVRVPLPLLWFCVKLNCSLVLLMCSYVLFCREGSEVFSAELSTEGANRAVEAACQTVLTHWVQELCLYIRELEAEELETRWARNRRNLDQRLLVLVWNTSFEKERVTFVRRKNTRTCVAAYRRSSLDLKLGLIGIREFHMVWHMHRLPKLPYITSTLWKRWVLNVHCRE